MKIITFSADAEVQVRAVDVDSEVVTVAKSEGYRADHRAVCELVRRPLFGFLPERREKVLSARRGDGTLLQPLMGADKHYMGQPLTLEDLELIDDQAFTRAELVAERDSGPSMPISEKYIGITMVISASVFGAMIIIKFLPQIRDSLGRMFGG